MQEEGRASEGKGVELESSLNALDNIEQKLTTLKKQLTHLSKIQYGCDRAITNNINHSMITTRNRYNIITEKAQVDHILGKQVIRKHQQENQILEEKRFHVKMLREKEIAELAQAKHSLKKFKEQETNIIKHKSIQYQENIKKIKIQEKQNRLKIHDIIISKKKNFIQNLASSKISEMNKKQLQKIEKLKEKVEILPKLEKQLEELQRKKQQTEQRVQEKLTISEKIKSEAVKLKELKDEEVICIVKEVQDEVKNVKIGKKNQLPQIVNLKSIQPKQIENFMQTRSLFKVHLLNQQAQ